ncbi:hypothetical protein NQZ68_024751, partial [Dissostichus eleginoides]
MKRNHLFLGLVAWRETECLPESHPDQWPTPPAPPAPSAPAIELHTGREIKQGL